jgi:multiple PDZ domain protein
MGMPPITTPTYAKEFKKVIEAAARGRQIFTVQVNYDFYLSSKEKKIL